MIFAQDYIDARTESKRRKPSLSWFDRFNLERVDRKLTRAIKRAIRHSDTSTAICAYMTDKEAEYLQRNIEYTQYAYQLDDVTTTAFAADNTLDAEDMDALRALDRGESLFPWDKGVRRPLRKALGYLHIAF